MTAGLFRIMIDQHLVTNFFFLTFMLRVNPDPVASEALAFVQHGDCFQGHYHLEIKLEPQDAYDAPRDVFSGAGGPGPGWFSGRWKFSAT